MKASCETVATRGRSARVIWRIFIFAFAFLLVYLVSLVSFICNFFFSGEEFVVRYVCKNDGG